MNKKPFVSAVIVSAGSSSRMGGINKQFLKIGGIPVIAHSAKAFSNCDFIDEIVIVTRASDIDEVNKIIRDYNLSKVVSVVMGGETRQLSVLSGVKEISSDADFIAIHDGARPLVTEKVIIDTLNYLNSRGGHIDPTTAEANEFYKEYRKEF